MGLNNTAEFTKQMQILTYSVMGIGLIFAVICIVISGMLLSASAGNVSKRNQGLTAILLACVGIYIIYKAHTIAGWAISLG